MLGAEHELWGSGFDEPETGLLLPMCWNGAASLLVTLALGQCILLCWLDPVTIAYLFHYSCSDSDPFNLWDQQLHSTYPVPTPRFVPMLWSLHTCYYHSFICWAS
jgi:hypothetical protein